jgi:hypothetical protein
MSTRDDDTLPQLFGEAFRLEPQDCVQKLERIFALVAEDQSADILDPKTEALPLEAELFTGCCEAFSLIERECFNSKRVVSEVNKHLLHMLCARTAQLEAIGFTAGMMFSNSTVPANTDTQARDSMTRCLGKAYPVCVTLEQEFAQIAALYRDSLNAALGQEFAREDANRQASGTLDPADAAAAALSYSRNRGRQNSS